MNSIRVPPWLTPGQKGNDLADRLDAGILNAASLPSLNTFYSPFSSVRYNDGSSKRCDHDECSNVCSQQNEAYLSLTNQQLFNLSPDQRAQILADKCNPRNPFGHIQRLHRLDRRYYWDGCTCTTLGIFIFFVLLQVATMLGGVYYYAADVRNPCMMMVTGALLRWSHAVDTQRLIAPQITLPAPTVRVQTPPPVYVRPTVVVGADPLAGGINPPLESAFDNSWLSSAVPSYKDQLYDNPQAVRILNSVDAGKYLHICSTSEPPVLDQCSKQWSVPSESWLASNPGVALYRFTGCNASCQPPSKQINVPSYARHARVCTCEKIEKSDWKP